MSEEFKIEIVNPEKSFLVKEDVSEVVVPAFEGEMGILKDHISIISFLKPGIIKVISKYYLPSGKSISGEGVTPDIVIEEDSDLFRINTETDNQLDFAVKLLNG